MPIDTLIIVVYNYSSKINNKSVTYHKIDLIGMFQLSFTGMMQIREIFVRRLVTFHFLTAVIYFYVCAWQTSFRPTSRLYVLHTQIDYRPFTIRLTVII
jgi:hypothetical protein